jgi:adenylate cyclase
MPPAQLLIRRHRPDQYAINFVPPASVAPAWTPAYPVTLTPAELDDLDTALHRTVAAFTQGVVHAPLETLRGVGRLLTHRFLPAPIRQALDQLPPQSPLSIITDASEIPWELLHPGEDFLALTRPVGRQHLDERPWAAGVYEHWCARFTSSQPAAPALLLIANPNGDLAASDQEAERILDTIDALPHYLRCTGLFREQASRATVLAELSSGTYTLIHYSGHADTMELPAATQSLRLADGALFAQQLPAVLGGAPLLFLNTCGSTQPGVSQELMAACLRAGAVGCVGARWPVSDLAAVDFSATFYQCLLRGQPVGAALWQARRAAYTTWPTDPTWAAFVLYGDPDWQPIPRPLQTTYLATVLAVRIIEPLSSLEPLRRLVAAVREFGGEVRRAGPDGLLATFGIPAAHEDQVQRAAHTALALRTAAGETALPVALAITTGSVTLHTDLAITLPEVSAGPAVTGALMLSQRASAGEILADLPTYQASAGLLTWMPRSDHAYQLTGSRPVALTALANVPLIGRETEVATLLAYWQRCRERRQRHVVGLVGEAGIGKTRLLHAFHEALAEQPDAPPVQWIDAQCPAHLKSAPFALLRGLLARGLGLAIDAPAAVWRQALTQQLADETTDAIPVDLPLLEQSLGLQPSLNEGRDVAEGVRRAQLAAIFKTLLIRISHTAPLILAIDDIYQADEPSQDIINQLIDSLDALPLLWLMLYRREWLPPWANKRRCHTLDLDELEPADSAQLLAAILPKPTPATVQAAILARAGGNPLFLEQLAHVAGERMAAAGGVAQAIPGGVLPSTLRLTIQARVTRLSAQTQTVLKLAAVAGSPFVAALLATVLNQTGEEASLEPALRELLGRDFLRVAGTDHRFYHPLIEEIIYAELPTVERQTLHRRLADVLGENAAPPLLVAWHRLRSVSEPRPDGQWFVSVPPFGPHYLQQVVEALAAASAAAWHSYANREVVRWSQAGLEVLTQMAVAGPNAALVRFHTDMGKALGRLGEFDTAIHHLQTAFDNCLALVKHAAQRTGLPEKTTFFTEHQVQAADLARQLGRLHMRQGHYTESLAWMDRGRDLIDGCTEADAQATRARIEVHIGAVYHWQGDLEQAVAHYQAGIELAVSLQPPALTALAQGSNGLGVVMDQRGQVNQSVTFFEQALDTWRTLGDLYEATCVQENLGNAYFYQNQWQAAQTHYQQSLGFWERIEERTHIPYSLLNLGGVHLCRGEWAAAEACYKRALALWEAVGEVRMPALAHINLARLALARGEAPTARLHLEQALAVLDAQVVDSFRAEAYATLAELYLQENAPEQTLIWAERAREIAHQQALQLEQGIAHRLLGQAYQRQQDVPLALEHLQRSLEALEATPNRYERGRTWVALAVLEQETGQREQAQARLEQASALFAELDAQPDWAQVQQLRQAEQP